MSSIQPIHFNNELLAKTLAQYHQDLERMQRALIMAARWLEKAQMLAEDLKTNAATMAKLAGDPLGNQTSASYPLSGPAARRGGLEPAPVARIFDPKERGDGYFEVRIDCAAEPLCLPPLEGKLLVFLASGANPDPRDPVVGWRSREEITKYLKQLREEKAKLRGKTKPSDPMAAEEKLGVCRGYPGQLVYLLRKRLGEQHRQLIQANRQKGWRFLLRRNDGSNVVHTRLAAGQRRATRGSRARVHAEPQPGLRVAARPGASD